MAEDRGKEEEKFDFTPEGEGYISLDEARILAVRTAVASPGDYGRDFRRVTMVFEVSSLEETDDFYEVTLSFRPQGNFDGAPGQEQFVVGKEGVISVRQVLSLPAQTLASPAGTARQRGGFPVLPVAIGLVVVGIIAAVGAVFAISSSGGDSVPIAVVPPTETPAPIEPTVNIEKTVEAALAVRARSAPPTPTPVPPPIARVTVVPPNPGPPSSTPTFSVAFVTKWGTNGTGDGQFNWPRGVAVAPDGSVYVSDSNNNRIQKFTSDGVFVTKWGTNGTIEGQFNLPRGVAVAPDGSVYVSDQAQHRIQKFTSEGVFVKIFGDARRWGSSGALGDALSYGVAVAPDGSIHVADTSNDRIAKYTSEGEFIRGWGPFGNHLESSDNLFRSPWAVAVATDGSFYVADSNNNRIQKFTSVGTFVTKWGTEGTGDGQFNLPRGVAVAPDGSVYVSDSSNNRIQKFSVGQ